MRAGIERGTAPRFSIVVLTRDEQEALPRLLSDLEGFQDRGGELVVVDTGSTDGTLALVRRHGCRLEILNDRFDSVLDLATATEIQQRFSRGGEGLLVEAGQRLFNFGEARQEAGRLATNTVVLQLDASDAVSALDIDALDRWIAAGGVRAFEYDQVYGNMRLRIARFFERGQYRWEGRVHEAPMPIADANAAPATTIRCDPSQLLVRHEKDETKTRNYLAGLALQVIECPDKPRWWHYLGRELYYGGRYHSAMAAFEAHRAMSNTWPAERAQSLCFLGECFQALGKVSEAQDAYRHAFSLDATRREPLLRLATLCGARGEFEATIESARQALEIPHTSAYPEREANYTWIPHALLYWSLFWLGRKGEAQVHWETCMALAPDESGARKHARLFPQASAAAANARKQSV
jgi:glycosyltransferase involved in cell wall biosynthesis